MVERRKRVMEKFESHQRIDEKVGEDKFKHQHVNMRLPFRSISISSRELPKLVTPAKGAGLA